MLGKDKDIFEYYLNTKQQIKNNYYFYEPYMPQPSTRSKLPGLSFGGGKKTKNNKKQKNKRTKKKQNKNKTKKAESKK